MIKNVLSSTFFIMSMYNKLLIHNTYCESITSRGKKCTRPVLKDDSIYCTTHVKNPRNSGGFLKMCDVFSCKTYISVNTKFCDYHIDNKGPYKCKYNHFTKNIECNHTYKDSEYCYLHVNGCIINGCPRRVSLKEIACNDHLCRVENCKTPIINDNIIFTYFCQKHYYKDKYNY